MPPARQPPIMAPCVGTYVEHKKGTTASGDVHRIYIHVVCRNTHKEGTSMVCVNKGLLVGRRSYVDVARGGLTANH